MKPTDRVSISRQDVRDIVHTMRIAGEVYRTPRHMSPIPTHVAVRHQLARAALLLRGAA